MNFVNPYLTSRIFGRGKGLILSSIYYEYYKGIECIYRGNDKYLQSLSDFFLKIINYSDDNPEKLRNLLKEYKSNNIKYETYNNIQKEYVSDFYYKILIENNLNDLRYLFKYGKYITDEEIELAEFLNNYSIVRLDAMASKIVNAFFHGFISQNRDRRNRKTVRLTYQVGQEKLALLIINKFKKADMKVQVFDVGQIQHFSQSSADHKYDDALFITEEYLNDKLVSYSNNLSKIQEVLQDICGTVKIIQFGEMPEIVSRKSTALKYSAKQNTLIKEYNGKIKDIISNYISPSDISYCAVGFPNMYISKDNFRDVFEDFFKLNMADSLKYEIIQQKLINSIDGADYIHIKGYKGNETDLIVKIKELKNAEKQTAFLNCGGDLNIPPGEIFTTPVLKGSMGLLHVNEVYLNGKSFIDLKLYFKDGFISDYSCENYDNLKANKKYIEENLLFPYKTLPIGEFAIGTNTQAYAIAKKYSIIERMPILLMEKMGPHLAIGDPCFARSEDNPIFNLLDGKEMVAKENEKTRLRHSDLENAYTNIHIDITLPYDKIKQYLVIKKNMQEKIVIENGKFVLAGTEELNIPLEYLSRNKH